MIKRGFLPPGPGGYGSSLGVLGILDPPMTQMKRHSSPKG